MFKTQKSFRNKFIVSETFSGVSPYKAADFKEIKSMILRENKLTPASYREKFNTLRNEESETFVMFTSGPRTMLSSCIESRHVETFEDLQELFLCDRVKNTLGPGNIEIYYVY